MPAGFCAGANADSPAKAASLHRDAADMAELANIILATQHNSGGYGQRNYGDLRRNRRTRNILTSRRTTRGYASVCEAAPWMQSKDCCYTTVSPKKSCGLWNPLSGALTQSVYFLSNRFSLAAVVQGEAT